MGYNFHMQKGPTKITKENLKHFSKIARLMLEKERVIYAAFDEYLSMEEDFIDVLEDFNLGTKVGMAAFKEYERTLDAIKKESLTYLKALVREFLSKRVGIHLDEESLDTFVDLSLKAAEDVLEDTEEED